MKTKTITFNELMKGNKRRCLSALRALGKCYKCRMYRELGKYPCESRIVNEEVERLLNYKKHLTQEYIKKVEEVKEKIEKL